MQRNDIAGNLCIAMTVLLTVYGQLIIKWRSRPIPEAGTRVEAGARYLASMLMDPWVISALAAAFAAALAWMIAMSRLSLTYAYPFLCIPVLIVPLSAAVALGSPISARQILGIALIFTGLLLNRV